MASKRPSGARGSASRRSPAKAKRPPRPWIRIIWGQVVRPPRRALAAGSEGKIQLRLKQQPGAARTIALTYALTKTALGK